MKIVWGFINGWIFSVSISFVGDIRQKYRFFRPLIRWFISFKGRYAFKCFDQIKIFVHLIYWVLNFNLSFPSNLEWTFEDRYWLSRLTSVLKPQSSSLLDLNVLMKGSDNPFISRKAPICHVSVERKAEICDVSK